MKSADLVFNTELRDNTPGCDRDSDASGYIDVSGYCSIVTVIPISDTSHTNHCHVHWYIFCLNSWQEKNAVES